MTHIEIMKKLFLIMVGSFFTLAAANASEPRCQITILGTKNGVSFGNSPVAATMTDGYQVPNGYRVTYYRVSDPRDCKFIAEDTVQANKLNLHQNVTVHYEQLEVRASGQEN